jgi:hypothetical protein
LGGVGTLLQKGSDKIPVNRGKTGKEIKGIIPLAISVPLEKFGNPF